MIYHYYYYYYILDTDGEYSSDNVLYTSPKSQSNLIDLIELQVHAHDIHFENNSAHMYIMLLHVRYLV